ncbi:hypothetical protein [Prosthecobacter sp.]|uniref:hypothetical protein n=1 Tax=Prosthecobacter sp. TaxID=1965333 RepID=UPI0037830DCA
MTQTHEPAQPDHSVFDRIEELASKSTEGTLTADERNEYEDHVHANKLAAALRRQARKTRSETAS